jgi:hypothetical protein
MRAIVAPLSALTQGLISQKRVETSRGLKGVLSAICVDGNVAQMPAAADVATDESATTQDRSTHRCAKGQHDDILTAPGAANPCFTKQSGMGVVHYAHFTRQKSGPFELFQTMHPAGHPVDVTAAWVGNAGGTQAYGQRPASCNGLQFMDKIADAMGE